MILKGTPATISVQFFDADTAADPGAVTVTVTRDSGTVLVASTAASGTGTNPRTFPLTSTHTATVDVLKATWVSATHGSVNTYHPVVGGFYVDLNTLRGSDKAFADQDKFPDQTLADVRQWWADLVDDYCGQSWIPRYRRELHRLRLYRTLRLDRHPVREILSATVNLAGVTTTVATSGWIFDDHSLVEDTAHTLAEGANGLLSISYEHGYDRPDGELYEAGITAMRDKLLSSRSGRASRQTLITNTLGTVRLAQPGESRATGIPEVDAVLNRRARILV